MKSTFRWLRAPLLLVATYLLCVTIHEAGHAVATLATGGKVKSFSVLGLRPHVKVAGKFSDAENAWKSVAGSGTFLIVWVSSVFLIRQGIAALAEVQATSAFFAFIEVLGWILSSIAYPSGPRNYDSWKFIAYTGVNSWVIAAVCLVLMAAGFWLHTVRSRPHSPAPSATTPPSVTKAAAACAR